MIRNGFTKTSALFYYLLMKYLSMVFGMVFGILQVQALSFVEGTQFLTAQTEAECIQLGGNFIQWENEIYCTKEQASFIDVRLGDPHMTAIIFAQQKGIVGGYADGTYKPDNTINRAEFLKILLEAKSDGSPIAECRRAYNYSDVDWSAWYGKYVQAASCTGIIGGYPDGTMRPASEVNYAEAAKIITGVFDLPQPQFVRAPDAWYEPYIIAVQSANGTPRADISPADPLTRGEMAEMVYGIMNTVITATPPTTTQNAMAVQALGQINRVRAEVELPALSLDYQLTAAAQRYSDKMVQEGFFNHTTPIGEETEDRFIASGYDYVYWGENLGRGQKTVDEAMEHWIASPPHYANMTSENFEHMGIGITKAKTSDSLFKDGHYWVLMFGSSR